MTTPTFTPEQQKNISELAKLSQTVDLVIHYYELCRKDGYNDVTIEGLCETLACLAKARMKSQGPGYFEQGEYPEQDSNVEEF